MWPSGRSGGTVPYILLRAQAHDCTQTKCLDTYAPSMRSTIISLTATVLSVVDAHGIFWSPTSRDQLAQLSGWEADATSVRATRTVVPQLLRRSIACHICVELSPGPTLAPTRAVRSSPSQCLTWRADARTQEAGRGPSRVRA